MAAISLIWFLCWPTVNPHGCFQELAECARQVEGGMVEAVIFCNEQGEKIDRGGDA